MTNPPVAGLILAGGAGRRMGGIDKAFLLLHGRPMLAHAIDRLIPQTEPIAISAAGDFTRFEPYGLAVIGDGAHRGKGPLAGILAGMNWAAENGRAALLSLPVDTPFAPLDLVAALGVAPAVATHDGKCHHLAAIWPADARDALAALLAGPGPYRVGDFARSIGTRAVEFPASADPFLNVNTPADLAAAAARS